MTFFQIFWLVAYKDWVSQMTLYPMQKQRHVVKLFTITHFSLFTSFDTYSSLFHTQYIERDLSDSFICTGRLPWVIWLSIFHLLQLKFASAFCPSFKSWPISTRIFVLLWHFQNSFIVRLMHICSALPRNKMKRNPLKYFLLGVWRRIIEKEPKAPMRAFVFYVWAS